MQGLRCHFISMSGKIPTNLEVTSRHDHKPLKVYSVFLIYFTEVYIYSIQFTVQPMETVLRKTRESTGSNCRNVRRRVRCQ